MRPLNKGGRLGFTGWGERHTLARGGDRLGAALDEDAGLGAPAPVGALTASNTTSSGYYSIGITGTVQDTSTAGGGTANVGLTTDVDGTNGTATTSYSDDAGEALNGTDLSNQIDAETALNDLNLAISDVAARSRDSIRYRSVCRKVWERPRDRC